MNQPTTSQATPISRLAPTPGSAVVQTAVRCHMTGGRRGGHFVQGKPAKVSMGGIIWHSLIPENEEEERFYNRVADSLCQQNEKVERRAPSTFAPTTGSASGKET